KRPHHVFIAKLSKRISRRNAQHLVLQQRNKTRHNARIANPDQCVQRGKRQKKISRVDYREQRFNRFGRAQLSERFDRVISNVHFRIVENVHQRQKRATVALLPKRVRGVDAQLRIVVAKASDERLDRIQTAQRQHLKRAVEDAQVPMFVAQRAQQRYDRALTRVLGEAVDRRPANSPAIVSERVNELLFGASLALLRKRL